MNLVTFKKSLETVLLTTEIHLGVTNGSESSSSSSSYTIETLGNPNNNNLKKRREKI